MRCAGIDIARAWIPEIAMSRAELMTAAARRLWRKQQFAAVLDQSIAGICLLSEGGEVLYVNAGFAELGGRMPIDLIGHGFLEFVAEADHELVIQNLQAALQGQQSPVEVRLKTAAGGLQIVLAQGAPTKIGGQRAVVGVAIDITGRRRAESALARANGLLRVIRAANEVLVRSSTGAELMTRSCSALVEAGHYRAASIALVRPDGEVRLEAVAGERADDVREMETRWIAQGAPGGHASAIRDAQMQLYQDWTREPHTRLWADAAGACGVHAGLYLPLTKDAVTFGSLGIYAADRDSFQTDDLVTLTELADDLAYGIAALRDRAERDASAARVHRSLEETVAVLAAAAEMRDPYTAGHQQQVALLAVAIARELGLDESRVRTIRFAALVHDVGKIRIPSELLSRPGILTDLERQLVQTHVQAGYDILKTVDFPWPIADFVLQHHEHLDGSGYPNGVGGGALHLESRILTVADVIEAMSADRPYRVGKGVEDALAEILDGRGSRYDADVVDACVRLFKVKGFAFAAPYYSR